jgi:hypothetical protein
MGMELARTLPKELQSSVPREYFAVIDLMLDGLNYTEIAAALSKGDPKVAKRWRTRIRRMVREPLFLAEVQLALKGEEVLALPAAVRALAKRAERGRVDAVKLLFESTGFYNPRSVVDHNHSGEINVNLNMGGRPEPIVDAEVVE